MYNTKKIKNCTSFRSVDHDMSFPAKRISSGNCKDCVYFSSRNCGMDVADSIEPDLDIFM